MKKKKIIRATVGAILMRNGKILLEKRKNEPFRGKWCLPGGHIEPGESPEQAIKREIMEETNLKIANLKFLFYISESFPRINWYSVGLLFEAVPQGKEKLNEESEELAWFNHEEIKKLDMAFNHKILINKYFKNKMLKR